MPKFVFQLEALLRHRENVEQQRQRELAGIRAQLTELESELRALDQRVRQTDEDVRKNHMLGELDLVFLASHRRYMVAMQRKVIGLAERMAAVRRQLDAARKLLAEAARDRKIIEKLKENRLAAWRADLARRETIELDEVSMQMAQRRSAELAVDAIGADVSGHSDDDADGGSGNTGLQ